jgi:hypothetical protein
VPDDFYPTPDDWLDVERDLFDDLVDNDSAMGRDHTLQELFDNALFDFELDRGERMEARDDLRDYLWEVYGMDFDESFDWEDYRSWYDSQ